MTLIAPSKIERKKYRLGSFEQAMVQYQKAQHIRPKKRTLKEGIQNCEEAMKNAIGNESSDQTMPLRAPDNMEDEEFFQNKNAGVVKDITERDNQGQQAQGSPRKRNTNHRVLLGTVFSFFS